MDERTAYSLARTTQAFYERTAQSFAETRQRPWPGWERVVETLSEHRRSDIAQPSRPLRVLDLGCGNMRFERFLGERSTELGIDELDVVMVDACTFPDERFPGTFLQMDILDALDGGTLQAEIGADGFDLVAAFGLMHHVPLLRQREDLLRTMIEATASGGLIAVSLWQPLNDGRIARKATDTTERGCADLGVALDRDTGDVLLGWQEEEGVYRYCHHFSDEEIGELGRFAEAQGCRVVDRFSPDSGSDHLNTYLVLEKA